MKHVCLHLLILFSSSLACLAQQEPWWELHGGFQFTSYQVRQMQEVFDSLASSTGSTAPSGGTRLNMIGWDFSAQENVNSWFGGIIDFSGGYGSKNVILSHPGGTPIASSLKPALFTMGGGPQFSYRKSERVQPFFRMICAAAYSNLNPNATTANILSTNYPSVSTDDTAFALIFGGGVDYRLKNNAFFRVAGDYIHTFLFKESEGSFRVTAGITFRIGSK
jgi:Outer membrane protein beta-barrel domain